MACSKGSRFGAEAIALATLLVIYVILLVTSMGFAAWVYILRNSRTCKSLIYFEDIAGLQRGSFVERSRRMDAPEIELQLLEQDHAVSKIASRKMRLARWSYWLGGSSFLLWVVLLARGSL